MKIARFIAGAMAALVLLAAPAASAQKLKKQAEKLLKIS